MTTVANRNRPPGGETGGDADAAASTGATDGADPSLLVGERRASATLPVIRPAVDRADVGGDGERVGAVAYPYRVYEAAVSIDRAFLPPRTDRFVASVDRSRRLVLRADAVPEVEERAVEDVLVLPSELSDDLARERAEKSVFQWTLRRYSVREPPTVTFERVVDGYKLFWLVRREGGTAIVDSVRGTEDPLED